MFKDHKMVMLPSKKASHLHIVPRGEYETVNEKLVPLEKERLLFDMAYTKYGYPPVHIYVLAGEPNLTGQLCLCLDELEHPEDAIVEWVEGNNCSGCRRIIATTDKSLGIAYIPDHFIKEYIEFFNVFNSMELMVELEYIPWKYINSECLSCGFIENQDESNVDYCNGCKKYTEYKHNWIPEKLILNPDNTINIKIKPVKEKNKQNFTREEVIELVTPIIKELLTYQWETEEVSEEDVNYHLKMWVTENL